MNMKLNLCLLGLLLSNTYPISAEVPDTVFAPYVDVTLWPTPSLRNIYEESGQKYFTLAFILQGEACTPTWAGLPSLDMDFYQQEIEALRAVGGDVIISFGGANGTELALGCSDENRLLAAYQEVIDRYDVDWVDFDIEGWAVAERTSIDRRSRVIRQLQLNNPDLRVAFCLPVLPQGLTADGLYVLESAKREGVRIDLVNVMAMDYGDSAAPDPEGQMGQYAILAAENTYDQLLNLEIDTQIGVTPMIGQNDVPTERFYLQDAQELLNWAQATPWMDLLSMWSSGRDNGNCPDMLSPVCSGIVQNSWDFTKVFNTFTHLTSTVAITTPQNGQLFTEYATITLEAVASTNEDSSIIQVEFFANGIALGTDTESPYSIVWPNVPSGSYELVAITTDDQGKHTHSSTVTIQVGSNTCLSDSWDASTIYTAGDVVSYDNKE